MDKDRPAKLAAEQAAMQEFRDRGGLMSPDQPAAAWPHRFDLTRAVPRSADGDSGRDVEAIFHLAPPPPAWAPFRRLVEARRGAGDRPADTAALLLLADVLEAEDAAEYRLLQAQFDAAAPKDQTDQALWMYAYETLAESNGDPEAIARQRLIEAKTFLAQMGIKLPPLVPWLGRQCARFFLE